ncbi:MAG TPA: NADH-quinone oxidoreductase subunit N [Steroidobacteraceae bacterium]|jgi:NADH-quinone oxidoreductase subunit N|nr:NADH-quinone oxidoreductase subunit N [Steroidobacteraceae bacterium]
MSRVDLLALLPYLVLGAAAVLELLVIAWRRHHGASAWICALGLMLAFAALFVAAPHTPRAVTPLLLIDGYALFYTGLVLLAALVVALLSHGYLREQRAQPREEYYVLLLLATLGAAVLVASDHFASFFLGLETLSISLLGLIGYPRAIAQPAEASIKYLILSGLSSALLLFGIALVYNELGTLSFAALAPGALGVGGPGAGPRDFTSLAGVALILVGVGFKLSVVPFHLWAPDIYQGAPAPVSGFVAVVSKCAVVALLLRYFLAARAFDAATLTLLISVIAVLSILAGNLLALLQDNVKRLLAYSSIAHLGYVLVAFLAGGALAVEAVSAYLVAYAITTLGAFGVVGLLSRPGQGRDADSIGDYQGLFWTRPALAAVLTVMLLSLAGIPLTLGFIAKFYAVTAGVGAHLTAPVTALVVGSIIGLYYYLRLIVALIRPAPAAPVVASGAPAEVPSGPRARACTGTLGGTVMAVLLLALVVLGVYPSPLVSLIRHTAGTLTAAADSLAARGPR